MPEAGQIQRWTIYKKTRSPVMVAVTKEPFVLRIAGPDTDRIEVVPAVVAERLARALREIPDLVPCHHPDGSLRPFCACCVARAALGVFEAGPEQTKPTDSASPAGSGRERKD